jgi:hypothetical protein
MIRMANILIVGEPAEGGLRNSLVGAFRHCGCTVTVFDLGRWVPRGLASAVYRWPMLGIGFLRVFRRSLDELADTTPADLVIVMKGALLNSRSIELLRVRFGSPVVCWNPDSPFDYAISNRGGGIPRTITAYDAYITWAEDVAECLERFVSCIFVVPFAWDPSIIRETAGSGEAQDRVVFIGTASRERTEQLKRLAHLRPVVYGNRWPRIDGIDLRPPVKGREFSKVVGEARWNINLLRPQNALSHNMRTFELVGAGGSQIAPATEDHRNFLGGDPRTVLFRTEKELESILRSDPNEYPMRPPGVLKGHTYADRVAKLLPDLTSLCVASSSSGCGRSC